MLHFAISETPAWDPYRIGGGVWCDVAPPPDGMSWWHLIVMPLVMNVSEAFSDHRLHLEQMHKYGRKADRKWADFQCNKSMQYKLLIISNFW